MNIFSRLPGCDGQAADAVSAYTQVKMEDAHKLLKITKSECPETWIRLPWHKWQKSWSSPSRSSWTESVWSSFGSTIVGKASWEDPIETWLGENSKLWMSLCTSWKRIILICLCRWHKIGWKETQSWSDVESTQQRSPFGRTNIFPGSCILGLHSTTMWNWAKILWTITEPCLNREFPRGAQRNCHSLKIIVFLHGPMTRKVMPRNVWNDIASWQTRRLNNSTKYLLHASMTTIFKRIKWNLLENCQTHALKLSWNARTWQELDDLIFYGQ